MSDMRATIVPKSDQQNYDDYIGGLTRTIKITGVKILAGDQPVALNFEGDDGKPYKPCKSMRRVLVQIWGHDGNAYIGRSLTLYGDPKVRFGGADVGGIRISHMSGITEPVTMALTATRAQRKPFTVRPLVTGQTAKIEEPVDGSLFTKAIQRVQQATTEAELDAAVEESRKLKGWPKATGQQMKIAIDAQRELINKQPEERQPGE